MKRYLVFLTDLALMPSNGNPKGGKLMDYDELHEAQKAAEAEKQKWQRVFVIDTMLDGPLRTLEHYHNGRKYSK